MKKLKGKEGKEIATNKRDRPLWEDQTSVIGSKASSVRNTLGPESGQATGIQS